MKFEVEKIFKVKVKVKASGVGLEDDVSGEGERSVGDLHGHDRGRVVPLEPADSMAWKPVLQVPLV